MEFIRSIRKTLAGAIPWLLAALGVLLISPARMWPWGCEGHRAVALIAEKHMNRHALESADKLLRSIPSDPNLESRCRGTGIDPFADSSPWADDIRKLHPETSSWHYIDIPRDAPRSDWKDFCPAPRTCVTGALARQIDLLRNFSNPRETRADALRFVIHLVADLHQPLHCVTNNDMGGNCVPVEFFGETPAENSFDSFSPNLHGIWDYNLVRRIIGGMTVAQWADSLDRRFRSQEESWQKSGVNFDAWWWESHELADRIAYGKLPVPIRVETPELVTKCSDANHVSSRMMRLHESVSQRYLDVVEPTLDEQVTKAGVRLAMILNQVWP